MNFHPLEHKILKVIRQEGLESSSLLLAISGGRDSMVLLRVMARLARVAKLSLRCVHIHHGVSKSVKQNRFRDRAQNFCSKAAQKYEIPFVTNCDGAQEIGSKIQNETEASLRDFRLTHIHRFKKINEELVLGHHSQDLLETRIMRLLRGVSPHGLTAMKVKSKGRFRPFITISSQEIADYAHAFKVDFVQDPSNQDLGPLRNWLRNYWLPELEKKSPGSTAAFSRSLEGLLQFDLPTTDIQKLGPHFSRQIFDFLPRKAALLQLRELYRHSYGLKVTDSQVHEVLKQLYISKKRHMFTVGGIRWEINAGQVTTSREMVASS